VDADQSARERAGWRRYWGPTGWAWLGAFAIIAIGTTLRMMIAVRNSETPMIDENEVVEQAVAFMGPDLHFYFLKYGPLTMYALAAIYRVAAALHGISPLEYASRVFLQGSEHYAIGRVYTLGWLSVLALVAFVVLRRQLGQRPALLVCALLAFPFVETLSAGARIDVPQAGFQCLALLALTEVVLRPRLGYWVAAGACAGLAVATKPLPGLLIAPSFLLASWFAAALRRDGTPRAPLARLGATFASAGLWLAALACVLCAVAGDPELLNLRQFIESQREAVALHSGNALQARSSIVATFSMLRIPFLACAAASALLVAIGRERRALVIGLFVVVYVSAFVGRASRTYFMVAPAAALCILIGYGWARAEALLARWSIGRWLGWAWVPLAALLVSFPAQARWQLSVRQNPGLETSRWMQENVPSGTRVFHLGGRPYGTYVVPTNETLQSKWGDHFEYGRYRYAFLKEAFHLGYQNYVKSGLPVYNIEVRDERPMPRSANFNKRWVTDSLVRRAREKKQKYIMVTGYSERDVHDLGYRWFDAAILEQQVSGMAIFRVPDEPPAPPPAPPDPVR
jgi:Dolichyl-phosphate-mannose-protein mannosyltransferase